VAPSALRPLAIVIALTLVALALPASAQTLSLRWIPSVSAGVSGYRAYVGPDQSGPITSVPINLGNPTPNSNGVASAAITLDRSRSWVAELTAYSSTGAESPRSNRVTIPALGESLGAPVYETDFTPFETGSLPAGYLDAADAFGVSEFADGNRALGTRLFSGRIVARYVGASVVVQPTYEISGRTALSYGTQVAGVAVRVPYSDLSQYFALGVDSRGTFALSQAGKAPLRCASSASTGVALTYSRWYRFKLRYTNPGGRARLRARVWLQGQAEPTAWQADCWTDVALATGTGAFALYRDGGGLVHWDDLAVRPVLGTLDPIP